MWTNPTGLIIKLIILIYDSETVIAKEALGDKLNKKLSVMECVIIFSGFNFVFSSNGDNLNFDI